MRSPTPGGPAARAVLAALALLTCATLLGAASSGAVAAMAPTDDGSPRAAPLLTAADGPLDGTDDSLTTVGDTLTTVEDTLTTVDDTVDATTTALTTTDETLDGTNDTVTSIDDSPTTAEDTLTTVDDTLTTADDTLTTVDDTVDDGTDTVENATNETTGDVGDATESELRSLLDRLEFATEELRTATNDSLETVRDVVRGDRSLLEVSVELAAGGGAGDGRDGGDGADTAGTTATGGDGSSTGTTTTGDGTGDDGTGSVESTTREAAGSSGSLPSIPNAPVTAGLLVGLTAALLGGARWLLGGASGSASTLLQTAETGVRPVLRRLGGRRQGTASLVSRTLPHPSSLLRAAWRTLTTLAHWLALVAGYSRYDDTDPLEHDTRATLHELIHDEPGSYPAALSDRADVPVSTVRYHLRILEAEGQVETIRSQGNRQYYPPGEGDVPTPSGTARSVLRSLTGGAASVSELARRLDRDPSTITHHLEQLSGDGLVERERAGRAVENRLTRDGRRALALADGSTARGRDAAGREGPAPPDRTGRSGADEAIHD